LRDISFLVPPKIPLAERPTLVAQARHLHGHLLISRLGNLYLPRASRGVPYQCPCHLAIVLESTESLPPHRAFYSIKLGETSGNEFRYPDAFDASGKRRVLPSASPASFMRIHPLRVHRRASCGLNRRTVVFEFLPQIESSLSIRQSGRNRCDVTELFLTSRVPRDGKKLRLDYDHTRQSMITS